MDFEQVTSPGGVASLLEDAVSEGRVALDTEFVWERTYAPALCLVQVATPARLALVDPLRGAPLAPLAELVADPAVTKVMHAPSGDLAAFVLHHGVRPAAVFDTQLAAGFAGYGGSLSLERLIEVTVGVRLRHEESFTDWQRRPLTEKQLAYAADDVRHLLAASAKLERRLEQLGRSAWASEEIDRRFGGRMPLVQDPREAWRRIAGRGRLRGQALAVLRELAAWREDEARRRDIPAAWLVRDATLVELARRQPATSADAEGVRGLQLRRGAQLDGMLAAVRRGREQEPPVLAEMPSDVRRRVRAVLPLLSSILSARASEAGIASELVATRDDLESLVRHVAEDGTDGGHPLLEGWRRTLAGESLVRLLSGEVALAVLPGPPHVEEIALGAQARADAD